MIRLLLLALSMTTIAASATPISPPDKLDPFVVEEFKKYPANVVHTFVKPQLVLKKGTTAYKHRDEIRRQFEASEINFAGYWILVAVGCGKNCSQFFMIDGVSGAVTDPKLTIKGGEAFAEAGSRLLYVAPKAWLEESGRLTAHEFKQK